MLKNMLQVKIAKKKLTELTGFFPCSEVAQIREVTTMDAKEFIEKGVVWLSDIYHPTIHIIISATERDFGPVISSHIAAWAEGAPCYIYYVDSSKV